MKKVILLAVGLIVLLSCDCPYEEFGEDRYERGYYSINRNQKNDAFYADMLLGGWQCDYPMIISGMGELLGEQSNKKYELKWMQFVSYNKCDITIQEVGNVERRVYTFSYLYDGNTIRLSRNNRTVILTIRGFVYPTLYLIDTFGRYTIEKKRAANC